MLTRTVTCAMRILTMPIEARTMPIENHPHPSGEWRTPVHDATLWRTVLAVLARFPELVALFDDCHLSLRVSRAAALLGLPNKSALHRLLLVRRLPPFQLFRNWCYVIQLTDRFANEEALSSWVLRRSEDPANYYKLVRWTTGRRWQEVKVYGPEWVRATALKAWDVYL